MQGVGLQKVWTQTTDKKIGFSVAVSTDSFFSTTKLKEHMEFVPGVPKKITFKRAGWYVVAVSAQSLYSGCFRQRQLCEPHRPVKAARPADEEVQVAKDAVVHTRHRSQFLVAQASPALGQIQARGE